MALLIYRQTLTLATRRWNMPRRKKGEQWVPIKLINLPSLRDKYDGSLRGAIIKIKDKLREIGKWECFMRSTQSNGYRIYTLVCRHK